MNMHVASLIAATTRPPCPPDDRDLIKLCGRADRLFKSERKAEQRVFDAEDNGQPVKGLKLSHMRIIKRLRSVLEAVEDTQAKTLLGMAYKASLLSPWDAAGFGFDNDIGRDLALSIAMDARMLGTGGPLGGTSAQPSPARPPCSDVAAPAQH